MLRGTSRIWNTDQLIFLSAFILALALTAVSAACMGEPSYEDVAAKEARVLAYEAKVEGSISYECEQQRKVANVLQEWDDLEAKYGGRDYYEMSDREKMRLLNDVEGILKKLEKAVNDEC